MLITHDIRQDLVSPGILPPVAVVQGDTNTRQVRIELYAAGQPWEPPAGTNVVTRYRKGDGTTGCYDTLPDGSPAWSIDANTVSVLMCPQMLSMPGRVLAQIVMIRGKQELSTFEITVSVTPDVSAGAMTSEDYINWRGDFLPAPDGAAKVGDFISIEEVDSNGRVLRLVPVALPIIEDGISNPVNPDDPIWSQWAGRLVFGMDPSTAPVPFKVNGQMFVDGTLILHNNGTQKTNRWGFHVLEAYAKDNYSRLTMLMDKHMAEAGGKPSVEVYFYIGRHHAADSYGNVKIGSDVAYHSFCFDRDKLTAYGEIDAKMPITLARISLANDLDATYETVAEADEAHEAENDAAANIKCLKYIMLKNAENGAMFYDVDRRKPVMKVDGLWCDIPFDVINDPAYAVLGQAAVRVPCTGITLSDSTATINGANYHVLTATVSPSDTTDRVVWKSSNTSVATVSGGVVTAVANGTTVITATCGDKIATCNITVVGIVDYSSIAWEQGVISGTGGESDNTARIRTVDYIPDAVKRITANSGYEFGIACYNTNGTHADGSANKPYYDSATNAFSQSAVYMTSIDLMAAKTKMGAFTKIRLFARRVDKSDLAPNEGVNIVMV